MSQQIQGKTNGSTYVQILCQFRTMTCNHEQWFQPSAPRRRDVPNGQSLRSISSSTVRRNSVNASMSRGRLRGDIQSPTPNILRSRPRTFSLPVEANSTKTVRVQSSVARTCEGGSDDKVPVLRSAVLKLNAFGRCVQGAIAGPIVGMSYDVKCVQLSCYM